MAIVKDEHLSRRAKLFYGTGDFGFALTDTVIGVLFAIFLTDVVGLAPALAAAAIFVGRTWITLTTRLSATFPTARARAGAAAGRS